MSAPAKITYTSTIGDLGEFHRRFDEALATVRRAAGARHPFYIGGEAVESRLEPLIDRSPIDTSVVLGTFACAGPADVDRAVESAKAAQRHVGPAPLARAPRHARARRRDHSRTEVRARRHHGARGREEPARGDG